MVLKCDLLREQSAAARVHLVGQRNEEQEPPILVTEAL